MVMTKKPVILAYLLLAAAIPDVQGAEIRLADRKSVVRERV